MRERVTLRLVIVLGLHLVNWSLIHTCIFVLPACEEGRHLQTDIVFDYNYSPLPVSP